MTFKICYQAARVSNITQLNCTKLPQVLPMNEIEIKIYKFPQENSVSVFDMGLFFSNLYMCLICDRYFLKHLLVFINISRK